MERHFISEVKIYSGAKLPYLPTTVLKKSTEYKVKICESTEREVGQDRSRTGTKSLTRHPALIRTRRVLNGEKALVVKGDIDDK